MLIPPYRITLSGGGIKGLAHIGALEVLAERGYLGAVKEYIGISAGALCAFALCVGTTLSELRMLISVLDFGVIRDIEPEAILSFSEVLGLDTGANVEKLLRAILRAKGLSPTLTFSELAAAKKGPALRVFATDLNACEVCEFSASVTPNVSVCVALRASICIPIYFQPVRHPETGHYLVDGGLVNHSPFKFLTADEQDTTLSITFSDDHKPKEEIGGLPEYLIQLYYSIQYHANRELTRRKEERMIFIKAGHINSLHFEMDHDARLAVLEAGRASAVEFLEQLPLRTRKPVRRFSVA